MATHGYRPSPPSDGAFSDTSDGAASDAAVGGVATALVGRLDGSSPLGGTGVGAGAVVVISGEAGRARRPATL
jgi:hypothetical protein